uniref:Uncharacterized protein n=1 Tax=viral metagenome TaxID=1070528 RepID=A0A6C0C8X5_9ZZZZ
MYSGRMLFNVYANERLVQIYVCNAENYMCDVCKKDKLSIHMFTNCAHDVQVCYECMLNVIQTFGCGDLCNYCAFQLKYVVITGSANIEICEKCTNQFNMIKDGDSLGLLKNQILSPLGKAELFTLSHPAIRAITTKIYLNNKIEPVVVKEATKKIEKDTTEIIMTPIPIITRLDTRVIIYPSEYPPMAIQKNKVIGTLVLKHVYTLADIFSIRTGTYYLKDL